MRFIPANLPKNTDGYKKSPNSILLEDFLSSGPTCAEVVEYNTKKSYYCTQSLNNSIKTYKMPGVKAITRDGKVYLVNSLKEAEGKK